MKAYKHLVKFALACKYSVSVFDGEEWAINKGLKYQEIIDAIESVEEANITIWSSNNEQIAWALVSAFGLDDDETVIDYSLTSFMEEWDEKYELISWRNTK